jgi:hypothetical protein
MTTYILREDGVDETIEATDLDAARKAADRWARSCDWDTEGGTVWVDTHIYSVDEDGDADECLDTVTTAIEQPEPKCSAGEHDWQAPLAIVGGIAENPGVWGHGGGVKITEVCMHCGCGCGKLTDTWAQRMDTGEQGLTEVTYTPGQYADEIRAMADAEDADAV